MKNTETIYCVIKQAYLCEEQCLKQTFLMFGGLLHSNRIKTNLLLLYPIGQ